MQGANRVATRSSATAKRMALGPATLVGLIGWALASVACAAETPPVRLLGVQGDGEVSLPPDLAFVRVGVSAEKESAAEAQRDVNAIANRILASVQELGIEVRDIRTVELQIFPRYRNDRPDPRSSGEPRIDGYVASNVVQVTVRKLDQLGKVVDAALEAGGNRVEGVRFALDDDREARKRALELAVEDAKSKAAAMSKALGAKLGAVHSLREGQSGSIPVESGSFATLRASDSMGTPTSPGELRVRAQVSLEYRLE